MREPYLEAVDSPELAYTPYERWELVVTTDVFATNGVIHVIDNVLLPPELMEDRDSQRASREMQRTQEAAQILNLAIERGVPLFNDGNPEATAAIYELAARAVMTEGFELPRDARRALRDGIRAGRHDHNARDRAWTYRGALDRALDVIEGRMARRDRH